MRISNQLMFETFGIILITVSILIKGWVTNTFWLPLCINIVCMWKAHNYSTELSSSSEIFKPSLILTAYVVMKNYKVAWDVEGIYNCWGICKIVICKLRISKLIIPLWEEFQETICRTLIVVMAKFHNFPFKYITNFHATCRETILFMNFEHRPGMLCEEQLQTALS